MTHPRWVTCPNCGEKHDASGRYTSPANQERDRRWWKNEHLSGACMKKPPEAGDRVRITSTMPEDPDPIRVGTEGTVREVHVDVGQIRVDWDGGRTLILLTSDPFEIVRDPDGED
ncbi:DUF4314 domain-containing protein [Brevibacterium oceani]|uniref:DUF4314 domain-containing protein n=1 Tax=Brevibacterium oceani TaxID=358099 RepID=UPI0015E79AAC|nr:DUF4314 domain-containing protein [Brevibacterium oceani]